MSSVKMTRNGQITLPIDVRRSLSINQGSFLEVKVRGSEIVIKPQFLVDAKELRQKAGEVIKKIQQRTKNFSSSEVEKDVSDAIKAVRKKH